MVVTSFILKISRQDNSQISKGSYSIDANGGLSGGLQINSTGSDTIKA
jgi:hypothetical protein